MNEMPGATATGTAGGLSDSRTEAIERVPKPGVVRGPDGRFAAGTARPGRRRPGAQAGNLNQTRHAWAVYWRKRALRPEDRWIAPLLGDYAAGLLSDKGGPEGVTAGEARMI